jgi:hypothetical protein
MLCKRNPTFKKQLEQLIALDPNTFKKQLEQLIALDPNSNTKYVGKAEPKQFQVHLEKWIIENVEFGHKIVTGYRKVAVSHHEENEGVQRNESLSIYWPLIVQHSPHANATSQKLQEAGDDAYREAIKASAHKQRQRAAAEKLSATKIVAIVKRYRELLLAAFLNRRSSEGDTALHLAVGFRRISTIDWLLDHGAQPSLDMLNNANYTPMTLAVRRGDVTTFQHLMERQKDQVWTYGSTGMTSLTLSQVAR